MKPRQRRQGVILVIVLVVVAVLALSAYTFSTLMIQQYGASKAGGRQAQWREVAESGVEAVRMFIAQDRETREQLGGTYDNPELFQGMLVWEDPDPRFNGRYTVIAPALDEDGNLAGVRYGLEDESARLNLSSLLTAEQYVENGGRELLMALPEMTEEIADAILDWIDEDDEPREFGVESEYYAGLQPPYLPKNAPLETVEELLLIKDVTPQLLFGLDINRNGVVDPFEGDGESQSSGTGEASMERGWSAYLALHGKERNFSSDGQQRIYINAPDLQELQEDLKNSVIDEEWASFILAYRLYGPYSGSDDVEGTSASGLQLDLSQAPKAQFTQVLDLVGAMVEIPGEGEEGEATVILSPVQEDNMATTLPVLVDNLTTNPNPTIPGRLNIHQAPRVLIAGIPGMDEDTVNEIISRRDVAPDGDGFDRQHETWLLLEGVVDLATMRMLSPFINVGGDVFRAQVVGYYQIEGMQSRCEVILDSTLPLPRILFWRDLSHLPQGYPVDVLGADSMDAG